MIQEYFSEDFKICTNKRREELIYWEGGDQFCKTAELFGLPFCISILRYKDPNSLSFIREGT